MLFQEFKKATGANKTPSYMEGEIARAEWEQAEKEQDIALKQQYASGGMQAYDAYNTPDSPMKAYVDSLRKPPTPDPIADVGAQPGAQQGLFTEAAEPAGGMMDTGTVANITPVTEGVSSAVPKALPEIAQQASAVIPESAGAVEAGSAFSEATATAGLAESMGTEVASTAISEALASGASASAAEAAGVAAIEAAATTAATTAGAGGAAAGAGASGALAAMGPVGWAALAAMALSSIMG